MKSYLLLSIFIFCFTVTVTNAQDTYNHPKWFPSYEWNITPQSGGTVPALDYGCALIKKRPVWILFSACGSGAVGELYACGGTGVASAFDVDTMSFLVWGPFSDTTGIINNLTPANTMICENFVWGSSGTEGGLYFSTYFEAGKIYYGLFMSSDSVFNFDVYPWSWFPNGPTYIDSLHCSVCNGHSRLINQHICIVTVDSATGKNEIWWTPEDSGMEKYAIYRQGSSIGVYDSIGEVPLNQPSHFIDAGSNPSVKSYTYHVNAVDSCGRSQSTAYSDHTTMHLTTSQGLNGEVNLVWNGYGGYGIPAYSTYYIFRSVNSAAYVAIDSIASATTTYTDLTPPAGTLFYKIGIKNPACFQGVEPYTFSNRSLTGNVGIADAILPADVKLFPNPSHDNVKVQLGSLAGRVQSLKLLSVAGDITRIIAADANAEIDFSVSNLPTGIYFLQINTGEMVYRTPIAVQ
ncbi:MAG TPA: T9SS type A sorting domain-containing protein [Chitinophagales bacterium]|nr:T9SS type A sorting domain-containing protein [Chitinophagales bacterium]